MCDIWGVQSGDFGADRSGGAPIAALYALRGVTGNKPPDSALDIRDIVDDREGFRGGFGRRHYQRTRADSKYNVISPHLQVILD